MDDYGEYFFSILISLFENKKEKINKTILVFFYCFAHRPIVLTVYQGWPQWNKDKDTFQLNTNVSGLFQSCFSLPVKNLNTYCYLFNDTEYRRLLLFVNRGTSVCCYPKLTYGMPCWIRA